MRKRILHMPATIHMVRSYPPLTSPYGHRIKNTTNIFDIF